MKKDNSINELINELSLHIQAFIGDPTPLRKLDIIVNKIDNYLKSNSFPILDLETLNAFKKECNNIYFCSNENKAELIQTEVKNIIEKQKEIASAKRKRIFIKRIFYATVVLIVIALGVFILKQLFQYHNNQEKENAVKENRIVVPLNDDSIESESDSLSTFLDSSDVALKDTLISQAVKKRNIELLIQSTNQIEGFPTTVFRIVNNTATAIRITSINISILSFEHVLQSSSTTPNLPYNDYSIELKQKTGNYEGTLPRSILIDANASTELSILFYSIKNGQYIEPHNIGAYSFQISFNTDSNITTSPLSLNEDGVDPKKL